MKKALRWVFYIIIALLIAGALIPFVFKDQIRENIKIALNDNLNAKVNFKDIDLSVFRDFPQLSLGISELSINGIGKFEGQPLFKAGNTYLSLPLSTLFSKDNNEITEITVDNPELNIIVLNKTDVNYDIVKPSTDTTSQIAYSIALKKYTINNGTLYYKDLTSNQDIVLKGLDHEGSGNFKDVDFDLITTTSIKDFNIHMDNIQYLKNATAKMDALIHLNTDDLSLKYENADILLNSLSANSSGYFKFNENEDIDLDINIATKGQSFKNILSVIPYMFTKDFANVKSNGSASLIGKIKGIYNGVKNQMPAFDFTINIDNGYLKYPSMPVELKDVFTKMLIKSSQAQLQDLSIDISAFKMKLGNDPIEGKLKFNLNDVKGDFNGKIDLHNWKQFLPTEGMRNLSGIITANIKLDSKIADIQNNNYGNIDLVGSGSATNLSLEVDNMLLLSINNASFTASPKLVNLQSDVIKYGNSDFAVNTTIENPLLIFVPEKKSKVKIVTKSNFIDLDEMISNDTSVASSPKSSDLNNLKENNTNFELDFSADKIKYNALSITNMQAKGDFDNDVLNIENLKANIEQSDLQMAGKIINTKRYLFNNDTLYGDINVISKKIDLNQFMNDQNQKSSQTSTVDAIPVPERTSIIINAKMSEVIYTNMLLKEIEGQVRIKDQKASLVNVVGNSLGGRIAMEGYYDTKNLSNPKVDIKLLFDNLKFREAFDKIEVFRKISPIAKYITGNFNSTFTFNSSLNDKMTPKLSSISSSGFFETLNGVIDNFIPFEKIGEKLGTQALKSIPLENTKNWFEVLDGKVIIHPFTKNWNDINMDIKGSHYLEGDMDYEIMMQIPRQLLSSNSITGAIEGGFSYLEKEASKYGVNLNQGEFIDLKINLTGKLNSPIIKIKPISSSGQSVKSQIETGIKNKVDETKKVITDKVNKEVDKTRDSVKTVIKAEVDKAKSKAEEKKNEAIDTVKSKVVTKVKDVVDKSLPDTLGGKSKEEIKDKTEKEIDKIKDKLGGWNPLKKKGG